MMAAPKTKEAKKIVDRNKPHLSVGTIGHVDAGKSTLSAAIIKLQNKKGLASLTEYAEIDKAPEEKTRGITINIKHIKFETEKRHYTLIDCPGHVDFLKNMILGASQMDGAILVVSSTTGSEKQTIEHLKLCKTLGIKHLIVLINDKTNISDDDDAKELLTGDVQSTLAECGYDPLDIPIFVISALNALNGRETDIKKLENFLQTIDNSIPIPTREPNLPFLMYVESKFQVAGQGTIVGGKVLQGTLKEGDSVQLVGMGKPKKVAVVRSMEMHKESIKDYSRPGDDIGISLRGIDFKDVEKGQVVGAVSLELSPANEFTADAYIFSKKEGRRTGFTTGYKPQFFIHTANITGEIILSDDVKIIEPDTREEKKANFRVRLIQPIYLKEKDTFIIRESGKTVGMGFVKKII